MSRTWRSQMRDDLARYREQLDLANKQIAKQEAVVGWFVSILGTRAHRLVSAARRMLRLKPEIPAGALGSLKNVNRTSAEQPKNPTSPLNSR